ncbi:MAG: MOSC domain-containing protein [Halobacteriales archaeon]
MARVTALFVAPAGGNPMRAIETVEAVADRGLRGDRYFNGSGYYSPFDVCQVTLIAEEAIETIDRGFDIDLSAGQHRRNIVIEGVAVEELLEHRFRIGEAEFVGTRPRPPCAHLEDLTAADGVARALTDGRGGICADVTASGRIAVDDSIEIVESLDRTDAIIDRLRRKHGDDAEDNQHVGEE